MRFEARLDHFIVASAYPELDFDHPGADSGESIAWRSSTLARELLRQQGVVVYGKADREDLSYVRSWAAIPRSPERRELSPPQQPGTANWKRLRHFHGVGTVLEWTRFL